MDQKDRLLGYSQLLSLVADDYMMSETDIDEEERLAILMGRENHISRIVLGKFMMTTARQLERLALFEETESNYERKQRTKIEKYLKATGMMLHHFSKTENRNGYTEILMTVSSVGKDYYEVSEVAELLSKVFRKKMLPISDNRLYIHQKPIRLCFQEEVRYQIFGGFAKATKDKEEVSGDNYLMREFGDGTYIAAIADGMGSGEEACRVSESVLELLERYVEAGLSIQDFRDTCNDFLYMRRDMEQSVTVDILECNQYTGESNFYKNGSCSSYLMQDGLIRKIPAGNQAFGVKLHAEKTKSTVFLESGDWIVMMSDGVMDFYADHEEILYEIMKKNMHGPNELATAILGQVVIAQKGKMIDDMTVLALYTCELSKE